jgi:hypothetical protein
VVLAGRSATDPSAGDRVGGVDRCMNRETRGGDRPPRFELVRRRSQVLVGLAGVGADARRSRHAFAPG